MFALTLLILKNTFEFGTVCINRCNRQRIREHRAALLCEIVATGCAPLFPCARACAHSDRISQLCPKTFESFSLYKPVKILSKYIKLSRTYFFYHVPINKWLFLTHWNHISNEKRLIICGQNLNIPVIGRARTQLTLAYWLDWLDCWAEVSSSTSQLIQHCSLAKRWLFEGSMFVLKDKSTFGLDY